MSDTKEKEKKKSTLSLSGKGTLSLSGNAAAKAGAAKSKGVAVEVRGRRPATPAQSPSQSSPSTPSSGPALTKAQREARIKALEQAIEDDKKAKEAPAATKAKPAAKKDEKETSSKEDQRQRELEELQRIEAEEKAAQEKMRSSAPKPVTPAPTRKVEDEREKKIAPKKPRTGEERRRGRLTVTQVLNEDYDRDRGPSLAAQRRAKEKARLQSMEPKEPPAKVIREVVVPEIITVQELSNRMSERSGDVIKELMKMGVMATINQPIDADTAELIIDEFGHKIKRVTEADIEEGLEGVEDNEKDLKPRPPVVTIMGHVDHGKTSLLDALRQTDVVAGEAGGITQHIGAYQVEVSSGDKITFLDTPGHAAFTEMRSRGANVTDIVILVVAANDSLMPQTIEAISHAKAADVPLIVAVNKIDLPDANPMKVKQDLLQHEVIVEDMGGDVQCVEISAKQKTNLDKLEEAILLQAEILEIKANPDRNAIGTVVEAKLEQGRGSVATVLIQKGTLKQGDIFVVGAEWGKVRALLDDKGKQVNEAEPGKPVEVLGLSGTPEAGDQLVVVESEAKARDIVEFRVKKKRDTDALALSGSRSSFDQMMAKAKEDEKQTLPVIIKADVHGSVEAIIGSLAKITEENEEVVAKVLHSGVGGITESDVTLANASGALIIGFNVRANAQARQSAEQEKVDIRYYNVIYNIVDDAKAMLSGMLAPSMREEYLGQAEIRQVFNITKVGKIAGCMVQMGMVKRGSKVRLLRDDVVIHEGMLKTLKRFKDEVKEVREGMECGMAFESYDDIKEGDVIECYDVIEEQRSL